jgi:hypothetical protein
VKVLLVVLTVAAAMSLAGCGSPSISKEAISGVFSVTLTKSALSDAGAGFALATSFDKANLLLELTPEGTYRIARLTAVGQSSLGEGKYTLSAQELSFGPDTGELGCSAIGINSGRYGWKVENDFLTFTLIADECDDRLYPLVALPWSRTEMPFTTP